MGNTCIAVGINQYQFFQPLSFSSADAQAIQQFWVEEANAPPSDCLLLTDTSLLIGKRSTYPNKETLLTWLNSWEPTGETVWFFFSGYGVHWQGVDYLMPVDGNPADIPGTGIPVRQVFESLRNNAGNAFVLLDINRSAGVQGTPVGGETLQLAQEMGITTILSAQLDQFSHEAAALGHGLFTAALLEALRFPRHRPTLENIERYLRDRLPELSEHHWRPIQTPLVIAPNRDRQQLLFPVSQPQVAVAIGTRGMTNKATPLKMTNNGNGASIPTPQSKENRPLSKANPTPNGTPANLRQVPPSSSSPSGGDDDRWQQLLMWGGGVLLVMAAMIGAVVRLNYDTFTRTAPTPKTSPAPDPTIVTPQPSPTVAVVPNSTPSDRTKANQAVLDKALRSIQGTQASQFGSAIAQASQIKPGDPLYKQAQDDISRWSLIVLDLAQARANQGNFTGAIAAAQLVSQGKGEIATQSQSQIARWKTLSAQQKANQTQIKAATSLVNPNQASTLNRAIDAVKKIPADQPGYAQAQKLTAMWSQRIYLLAQSRAARGQYAQAIQTAKLIPANTPAYKLAQNAIAIWQKKVK